MDQAEHEDPEEGLSWNAFKTVMLNALGTRQKREQQAFESLKNTKQRPNQSPTDLLGYFRPLWEELGSSHTLRMEALEFTAALRDDIRKDLMKLPLDQRDTLPAIEESANIIFRQNGKQKETRDSKSNKGQSRPRDKSSDREETRKDQKKPKYRHQGYKNPKRLDARDTRPASSEIKCYFFDKVVW